MILNLIQQFIDMRALSSENNPSTLSLCCETIISSSKTKILAIGLLGSHARALAGKDRNLGKIPPKFVRKICPDSEGWLC
jgi:hypothetical protein